LFCHTQDSTLISLGAKAFQPSNHQGLRYYTRDGQVEAGCLYIQARRLEAPNDEAGLSERRDNARPVQALATPKQ
jgi:hypothetical protein